MITFVTNKAVLVIGTLVLCLMIFIAIELLYIKYSGKPVPAPTIPHSEQKFGSGQKLTYAVIGDSTGVGQGAEYINSIAVQTAQYMAKQYTVHLTNFAISGATTSDVLENQVNKAVQINPDIVLIAVGANDVTKLTKLEKVKDDMSAIITTLRDAKPNVRIVLTGSPEMGSVPRFPWPISYFAKARTVQINDQYKIIAKEKSVVLAPIAEKTGEVFATDPELFAQDKFHPNDKGYEVWIPVLTNELKSLLQKR